MAGGERGCVGLLGGVTVCRPVVLSSCRPVVVSSCQRVCVVVLPASTRVPARLRCIRVYFPSQVARIVVGCDSSGPLRSSFHDDANNERSIATVDVGCDC